MKYQQPMPIKIGRISYINVAPVYFGIDHGMGSSFQEVVSGPPSRLNKLLANGIIQLSPVSSFAYACHSNEWQIIPDLSISSSGPVESVLLASSLPLEELDGKRIFITGESASASALLKIIFAKKGINPIYEKGVIGTPGIIPDNSAAVLAIGNIALSRQWRVHFDHIYDLGSLWKEMTGLPFVFAVWAVRADLASKAPGLVSMAWKILRISRDLGMTAVDQIAMSLADCHGFELDFMKKYFSLLKYDLDPLKIQGMKKFFKEAREYGLIKDKVCISFFKPQEGKTPYLDIKSELSA